MTTLESTSTDTPPAAETVAHSARPDRGVALLYLLFFLSGAAALIYEVMWTRRFGLVFGCTTRASAAVLSAFFAGMAGGNLLGGFLARGRVSALRRYALMELLVAGAALLVDVWLSLYDRNYPALYRSALASGGTMTATKLLLALVALGPPCVAMGATLPLMARAIVGRERRLGRRVAGVYGINTVGAVVGVIAAGFFLPLWIGTHGSVLLAAGINVLVAVVALLVSLGRTEQIDEPEAEPTLKPASMPDPEAGEAARRWDPAILFAAAASGFGTLALEVLFTRMIVNATDSSVFSFAMMLATFLICLALGSFIVSLWVDRMARPWRFLAWTQSIAAITIMASPFVFRLAGVTLRVPRILPGYDYLIWLLMFSALVMGPTVLLVGVMLPTVWKLATRRSAQVGRNVGLLTGLNTFTAVLGSAAAGFLIIPLTGVNFGIVVIAMLYGAVAMVCWLRGYEGGKRAAGLITVGLALAFLYDRGIWTPLPVAPRPNEKIVSYHDGEAASVAVTETPQGVRFLQVNNRYLLGSSSPNAVRVQRSQGRLPLLLHPQPRDVAFIGIATGVSVSAVTEFPVDRVVAIELVPGVVDATKFFENVNRRVLHNERVETLIADGRNHLYATKDTFDVIVGDLYVPWHAGTGYLYTTEHFTHVADRLKDGGVFAQWLQANQVTLEELRIITAGFLEVFPTTELWVNGRDIDSPVLALVGFKGIDSAEAARRRDRLSPVDRGGLAYVASADGLRRWSADAPRNTDNHPIIEFKAAAAALTHRTADTRELLQFLGGLRAD